MNRLKLIQWIMVSMSVVMLSACGGGSSGGSTPVPPPTAEEIQAEAIETISNYEEGGEAPTVEDYANAGITDVNAGNIDSINEALLEEGTGNTQEDIQDIADVAGLTYEDAENGDTNGWSVYDTDPAGATIKNVQDDDKATFDAVNGVDEGSRVIQLSGYAQNNGYKFGGTWDNTKDRIIKWSMKVNNDFTVFVHITTTKGDRHFTYKPVDGDKGFDGRDDKVYTFYGLGTDANDGTWKTFKRDLTADLKKFESDNKLLTVNYFKIRGDCMVDDIKFSKPE